MTEKPRLKPEMIFTTAIVALSMTAILFALPGCANPSAPSHESARSTYVDEQESLEREAATGGADDVMEEVAAPGNWEKIGGTSQLEADHGMHFARIRIYRDPMTDVLWVYESDSTGSTSFHPRVKADGTYLTYGEYVEAGGK